MGRPHGDVAFIYGVVSLLVHQVKASLFHQVRNLVSGRCVRESERKKDDWLVGALTDIPGKYRSVFFLEY